MTSLRAGGSGMTKLQSINYAREEWLVFRINFDDTSSIANLFIVGLTQETHFEEGSSERIDHQLVVDWKSIRSDGHQYMKENGDSRAKDCQVHAVRGSRASCQRYQNDEYRNKTSSNNEPRNQIASGLCLG